MTLEHPGEAAPYQPRSRREARALQQGAPLTVAAAAPAPLADLPPAPPLAFPDPAVDRLPLPAVRHVVETRPSAPRRGVASRLLSAAAMTLAAAFVVGVSLPANAFNQGAADASPLVAEAGPLAAQSFAASDDSADLAAGRDDYEVKSWAELLKDRALGRNYSYTITSGSIRWPFPYVVPIGDGYGYRVSPCIGCSSYHQGTDFLAGNATPIFAVFGGTVVLHEEDNWSYGNYVEIEMDYQGHTITSLYGHMQRGSSELQVGDQVEVGDIIGLVGATGEATGPHLHLEIWVDGVKVDPFVWLQKNAN